VTSKERGKGKHYENGRNFPRVSSSVGDFSSTWAIEGGRLHLIVAEYELLAAVKEDVNDEMEVRKACPSSFCVSGLEVLSYLKGRSAVAVEGPSGIAESEDTAMLGLGGSKEEVDEEGDPDMKLTEERLLFM